MDSLRSNIRYLLSNPFNPHMFRFFENNAERLTFLTEWEIFGGFGYVCTLRNCSTSLYFWGRGRKTSEKTDPFPHNDRIDNKSHRFVHNFDQVSDFQSIVHSFLWFNWSFIITFLACLSLCTFYVSLDNCTILWFQRCNGSFYV